MKKTNKAISWFLAVVMVILMMPLGIISTGATVTLVWPVPATEPYTGTTYSGHNGRDIAGGRSGATVVAALGGTVIRFFTCTQQHYGSYHDCYGYGTGIVIKGTDGRFYQYAHMQGGSIPAALRSVGANVSQGQEIGKVGQTGNASGPHLHFGISQRDPWTNDAGYVDPHNETYGPLDSEPPTISNPFVSDISESSFTINCDLNDNIGVTSVWAIVYGPNVPSGDGYRVEAKNGRFSHTIKTSKYGGPGEYAVGIYAEDAAGNSSKFVFEPIYAQRRESKIEAEQTQFSVQRNGTIDIALKITNAKNAESGTISVRYDPNKLKYVSYSTDNTQGSLNDVFLMQAGELYARFIFSRSCSNEEFSLATLSFKVLEAGETNLICQVAEGDIEGIKIPDIAKIKLDITWAECAHKWNNGVVTLEPTCKDAGEKTFTCALCGETKTETIPPTGEHDFGEWTVTKAATVEKEGEETRTCSVCGKTETRAIPKIDPTPEVIYGDADGSGTVDLNDCLMIMDYFVGKDVEIDEKAADANGDGTVDLNDCLLIMDFFVGKDVVLGPES